MEPFQGQVSTDGDDASPETRVAKIFEQMDKNNVRAIVQLCIRAKKAKRRAGTQKMM